MNTSPPYGIPYSELPTQQAEAFEVLPTCPQCGETVEDDDTLCEPCEHINTIEHRADILFDDLKYPTD